MERARLTPERRLADRKRMGIDLPVFLKIEGYQEVFGRIQNVSPQGLGLIVSHALEPDTIVTIVTTKGKWQLKVSWCNMWDGGNGQEFACGLVPLSSAVDFEAMLSRFLPACG